MIHNWMMILVPPLIIGGVMVGVSRNIDAIRSWQWWLPGLMVIFIASFLSSRLASLWLVTGETGPQNDGWSGLFRATFGRLSSLTEVAGATDFWQEFFWSNPFNLSISVFVLLGIAGLVWLFLVRRNRGITGFYFWPMFYLYILFLGIWAEFLILLQPDLRQPRYAAPFLLIGFMILGGWSEVGLRHISQYFELRIDQNTQNGIQVWRPSNGKLAHILTLLLLLGILAGFGPLTARRLPQILFEGFPPVAYEKAFQYVKMNFRAGDILLSPMPVAGRLFFDDPGYFVAQDATSPYLHVNTEGILGDRWVGAPWLPTTKEFKGVLAGASRTWLVVDAFSFDSQFHSDWKQLMRYNMTRVWEEDGVTVFAAEGLVRDIPTEPDIPLEVVLEQKVKLIGYSREIMPEQVRLVLFWQVLANLSTDYTTFVHIRNQAGETIAQVDIQPMSGEYPTSRWRVGETVTDEIKVPLPTDLPSGNYHLLLGLYRWDTLERLGVANDSTGENAIELETLTVP
jgi:hypothetical protein